MRKRCPRMEATIEFEDTTPDQVFEIMGDPDRITDWYLLAERVRMHPAGPDGSQTFDVVFTFFGEVFEEVLEWNPPRSYSYQARGPKFPISDYQAEIAVKASGSREGVLHWRMYFDHIEGENFRRILPVMLPPVMEESIVRLSKLIGGVRHSFKHDFTGLDE